MSEVKINQLSGNYSKKRGLHNFQRGRLIFLLLVFEEKVNQFPTFHTAISSRNMKVLSWKPFPHQANNPSTNWKVFVELSLGISVEGLYILSNNFNYQTSSSNFRAIPKEKQTYLKLTLSFYSEWFPCQTNSVMSNNCMRNQLF